MAEVVRPQPELARLGVLAFGDSITNGGGELQWGVALQSWALWTARGLGLPYSGYAVDGARAADVIGEQIPMFAATSPPSARYDLGCLYIGVNDVRGVGWESAAFAADYAHALGFLAARCDRLLTVTAPVRLGRPRAGADTVGELNAIVRRAAADHAALLVELEDFGARNQVMVDHVHPTAFGQVAIARRALATLAADGMRVRVDPATLISPSATRAGRIRSDAAYVWRDAKHRAREAWRRLLPGV